MTQSLANGTLNVTEDSYEVDDSLIYTCNDDYATFDPVETICRENFTWSLDFTPPVCSRSKF